MAPNIQKNWYRILGVTPIHATDIEIKRAYKRLALKHHPDKNAGSRESESIFKDVNEAHEILTNPDKRARFDRALHLAKLARSPPPPFSASTNLNQTAGGRVYRGSRPGNGAGHYFNPSGFRFSSSRPSAPKRPKLWTDGNPAGRGHSPRVSPQPPPPPPPPSPPPKKAPKVKKKRHPPPSSPSTAASNNECSALILYGKS